VIDTKCEKHRELAQEYTRQMSTDGSRNRPYRLNDIRNESQQPVVLTAYKYVKYGNSE
jgi:hypothetical protein